MFRIRRQSSVSTTVALVVVGIILLATVVLVVVALYRTNPDEKKGGSDDREKIALPEPKLKGQMSLEEAIAKRRSKRDFKDKTLSLEQVGQLCWVGQGISDKESGHRTAPSAGAKYPLALFLLDSNGVFEYAPGEHALRKVRGTDLRDKLPAAAYDQPELAKAPCCIVVAMNPSITAEKYGKRADRFCLMESGHAAQNILLEAVSLGLGAVPIGGFDDDKVAKVLKLPGKNEPVYLIPVGYPED
jgi:SagB-type dehydrogenase family enzyme